MTTAKPTPLTWTFEVPSNTIDEIQCLHVMLECLKKLETRDERERVLRWLSNKLEGLK